MAYGQIDPARLEGEALRRWYLRSPADIEAERRSAAAQRYDQFFSRGDPSAQNGQPESPIAETATRDFSSTGWTVEPNGRWHGARLPTDDAQRSRSAAHQMAANGRARGASSHETPGSCISCHGRLPPPPLPPPFGTFPFPNGSFPSFRDIPSRSPSGSGGSNPKQCTVQYENDSEICRQVPSRDARRRCWESAAEREAYCVKSKGEVGYPSLITR
jgi:hypothetical protein